MYLVDKSVHITLASSQRGTVGRVVSRQALQRSRSRVVGIDLADQITFGVGPDPDKHAPALRIARDQLVTSLVLNAKGDGAAVRIVGEVFNGRRLEQLLTGTLYAAEDGLGFETIALAEIQGKSRRALTEKCLIHRIVVG